MIPSIASTPFSGPRGDYEGAARWEHAKRTLLIVIFKRACLHAMSVGVTMLAVQESHNSRLIAEALGKGLDGGRVGVLEGVKLPIMAEEHFNKCIDVPRTPRLGPLPVDMVEGTWVWGGLPVKLDEVRPFSSRQMHPVFRLD